MAESRRTRKTKISQGKVLSIRVSEKHHEMFYQKEETFHKVTGKTVGEFMEKLIEGFKV
jgi:hypothetical protein